MSAAAGVTTGDEGGDAAGGAVGVFDVTEPGATTALGAARAEASLVVGVGVVGDGKVTQLQELSNELKQATRSRDHHSACYG